MNKEVKYMGGGDIPNLDMDGGVLANRSSWRKTRWAGQEGCDPARSIGSHMKCYYHSILRTNLTRQPNLFRRLNTRPLLNSTIQRFPGSYSELDK